MSWIRRHRWALLGWGVFAVGVTGAFLVQPENARLYATIWTAATAIVSVTLVVAYVVLSYPSRDENGKRRWLGEWQWFGALITLFAVVFTNQFVGRLTVASPPNLTPEYLQAQQRAAITAVLSFVVMSWVAILWARNKVRAWKKAAMTKEETSASE